MSASPFIFLVLGNIFNDTNVPDNSINTNYYVFYDKDSNKINGMYYSNTSDPGQTSKQVKYVLDRWYNDNLKGNYASKISIGNYFCEQIR